MFSRTPGAAGVGDEPPLILQPLASHQTFYPPDQPQNKPETDQSETISFSRLQYGKLEPYLPPVTHGGESSQTAAHHRQQGDDPEAPPAQAAKSLSPAVVSNRRPFVTLTYAQSLDSQLSVAPGARTILSGAASKAMTHFLRSRHAAILVGVGTAAADDPGLNCRLEGGRHQPRPVVLDPSARWEVTAGSKVGRLAAEGKGKGPLVLYAAGADGVVPDPERMRVVESMGGRYVGVPSVAGTEGQGRRHLQWESVLDVLRQEGIDSVMIEGGGKVINDLLTLANRGADVIDSVIITIAPTWLGYGGVGVAPDRPADGQGRTVPGPRLGQVSWAQMGEDMVLCGKVKG